MFSIGYVLLCIYSQVKIEQNLRPLKGWRKEPERTEPISMSKFSPNSPVDPANMCAQGEYIKIKDLNRNSSRVLRSEFAT